MFTVLELYTYKRDSRIVIIILITTVILHNTKIKNIGVSE